MDVKVRLDQTSQPLVYADVLNTYEKGGFYCIYREDESVKKIPVASIFDVTEEYGEHP